MCQQTADREFAMEAFSWTNALIRAIPAINNHPSIQVAHVCEVRADKHAKHASSA
jgi:hypothetical protein